MFAFRGVVSFFAAAIFIAMSATAASACGGYYGCGFGHGYWYGGGAPVYGYAHPVYAEPSLIPAPRRYFVDQGPDYTGPNVSVFFPRSYNPGFVDTFAYPYVGRYAGWHYRTAYAPRAMHIRGRHHHRYPGQFGWPR
ncbi:MAG: hypothetical protein ACXWJW_11520 [Xanthobacteraceae bacterium]